MPLPICIEIPEIPDPFQITLPGGVTMEHINLMEVIQPALTPLVPLFNIIDTVVAVFNCIKAIPDTLGPPPDPTAIAACIPELAAKVNALYRTLRIGKQSSDSTVVWHPDSDLPSDTPADAAKHFLCVEAANTRLDPVWLVPGAQHLLGTTISRG